MDEKLKIYKVRPLPGQLNAQCSLKPNGYLELAGLVADKHLDEMNMGISAMLEKGYAWVLTAATVRIHKPVRDCAELTAHTWLEGTRGPYARRELEFFDVSGQPAFTVSYYSVLFNVNTRHFENTKDSPYPIECENPESKSAASPRWKIPCDMSALYRRIVMRSDLDCLGHVHNCRYAAYAYDALTDEQAKKYESIREFEVLFRHELSLGEQFTVSGGDDGSDIYVTGSDDTRTYFEAVFRA